jgi:hypothetical protein
MKVPCPEQVKAYLEQAFPGRGQASFRYAVRSAVSAILTHEARGVIAVPATTREHAAGLQRVSEMLAAIRCECPGTCPRHGAMEKKT